MHPVPGTLASTEGRDRRAAMGAVVLLVTCVLSNLASLHVVAGDAFDQRAASHLVRELGGVGYFAQMAAGIWLSLALLFDARRGARVALPAWLGALVLFCVPVPALWADVALTPAMLLAAALLAVFSRSLEVATRRDAA